MESIDHYYHAATLSLGYSDYKGDNKRKEHIGILNFSRLIQYIQKYLIGKKEIYLLTPEYEIKTTTEIYNIILNETESITNNIFPNKSSGDIFNDTRLRESEDFNNNKIIQKIERDFSKLLIEVNNCIDNHNSNINEILDPQKQLIYDFIQLTISRSPIFNIEKNIIYSSNEIKTDFDNDNPVENQFLEIRVPIDLTLFLNDSLPIFPLFSNNFNFSPLIWHNLLTTEEYILLNQANLWFYPITHKTLIIIGNKSDEVKNILNTILKKQQFFDILFSANLMACSTFIVFNKKHTDYFLKNTIQFILKNHYLAEIRKKNYNTKLFKFIHKIQRTKI